MFFLVLWPGNEIAVSGSELPIKKLAAAAKPSKQTKSSARYFPMYQTHWGLQRAPFPSGIDPQLFYEGASQGEALARMRFLVTNSRRLGLLLGQPGLGKSLLLELFADECHRQGRAVAQVNLLGLSTREFYDQLGASLSVEVRPEYDVPQLFRRVADRLAANRLQGTSTVVLLDDADQAGADVLTQIARLTRIEPATGAAALTLILSTDPAHTHRLPSQLLELVDLSIRLEAWEEVDTIGYLQLALVEAGSQRPLFEESALAELHRLAAGVPRRVNRLADIALLAGSSSGLETIDAATVQTVHETG